MPISLSSGTELQILARVFCDGPAQPALQGLSHHYWLRRRLALHVVNWLVPEVERDLRTAVVTFYDPALAHLAAILP